jgi:hypothetical protein
MKENELEDGIAETAHFVVLGAVALMDADEELQPLTNRVMTPRAAAWSRTVSAPANGLPRESCSACCPAYCPESELGRKASDVPSRRA